MNVSEQAPGVFFVEGPASNWLIVRDDSGFMLIDGGYPADRDLVLGSIRELGLEPAEAKAMLISHGHVDHTGSAAYFSRTFGTPILCSPEELAHVQGKVKHQVTLVQVLVRAWRPRVFRWMLHVIKAKALQAEPATQAAAWTVETLKVLPGKPEAILLPGHTPGNVALLLPAAQAIAVGDTFVSGHPISTRSGPQMLHKMYHSDPAAALVSAQSLALANSLATVRSPGAVLAKVILPGHGPALHMPLADALSALQT
ncbi:MBL fold metallo-hydrolase [Arthrobacter sp. ISL-95]|uniref:MBL fold metallo-hydrolase n=1 Tax=Arthrobacter sp. ISL-95 TaxID=2819116 RepID=UPI001BE64C34|nr:MBL fold metallo-hydrolase [Arthrobacter sp. ISL-95]MBT2584690.1 MBL fold metallo-hydrolase [Arthrobacter sp. ISL-95]